MSLTLIELQEVMLGDALEMVDLAQVLTST
jgi:hypothetical protein